jgi:long-chain acyl-CoA synthetase
MTAAPESELMRFLCSVPADATTPAVIGVRRGPEPAETLSRKALFAAVSAGSAALRRAGIGPGQRVLLLAPNSPAWVISALAVLDAGATLVPVDAQMASAELAFVAEDAAPALALSGADRRDELAQWLPAERVYLLGAPLAAGAALTPAAADRGADAGPPAVIFYTSGTTGTPKGVPLTAANLISNVSALLGHGIAHAEDRILVPLPFHHVYPFTLGLLVPLRLGAPLILPASLVGAQIVRALQAGQPTIMLGVPGLYQAVWSALQARVNARGALAAALFQRLLTLAMGLRARLGWRVGRLLFRGIHQRLAPSLRLMVSGGAALDPALGERLLGLGWDIATGYGLSETSPILTINPPERLRLERAGLPLRGVELRIAAPAGARDGAPPAGEVQARGANVFAGYWRRPEASAQAFTADGWFRTGDLGWFDTDGYLALAGRQSAMIVLPGGENIDPERVEQALAKAGPIREAGVLELGGQLLAILVADADACRGLAGEALQARLTGAMREAARALPSHSRPARLLISPDPLPRTRLGKLRRKALIALQQTLLAQAAGGSAVRAEPIAIEAMAPDDQQLLSDPAARAVWALLCERYPDRRLTPDTVLAGELGIDSLAWMHLAVDIEHTAGLVLDDPAIARIESVRDLLREATAAEGSSEPRTAATADADDALIARLRDPEPRLPAALRQQLAPRSRTETLLGRGAHALLRSLLPLLVRVRVEGALPERAAGEPPQLIMPRHLSALDPMVLALVLPRHRLERLRWAGWTGLLFNSRLRRRFSRAAGILPIDPQQAPRDSLLLAASALARGHDLVWFPEGQRARDGRLQPFQPGIASLVRAAPVSVVPVSFTGTDRLMPPGRWLPRRGAVTIRIGAPLPPFPPEASADATLATLEARVRALSEADPHT